jgi:DNA-binding IclR family transcriptional regulator
MGADLERAVPFDPLSLAAAARGTRCGVVLYCVPPAGTLFSHMERSVNAFKVNASVSPTAKPVRTKTRLSSVANALRLMKTFSDDDTEIGISGLAQRLGLAKSTVHRLAATLISEGMLEQDPDSGKYRLGLAVFELGALVRRKMDVSAEGRPFLKTLRDRTGETVHLAVLDHASVFYVYQMESPRAIRMSTNVGARAPVHCTSDGKALLAFHPDESVEAMCGGELAARTPNTITDAKALRRDLAAIRARGYAIDDEESELGMRSVAAPIRADSGAVVASLSIAGPTHRVSKKVLQSYARDVMKAAEAISQRLGYQPARALPSLKSA